MIGQSRRQHLAMLTSVSLTGVAGRAVSALADERYKSPPLDSFSRPSLAKIREAAGIPAMTAAYADKGGKPVLLADGLRSIGGTAKVTTGDLWHIGSLTKSMTATLVARMAEQGGIGWDTTIAEILSPFVPKIHETYKAATLRHLCCHHAGLQRDAGDPSDPHPDRIHYAATALELEPAAKPGEKLVYSNTGYVIAATMLEVVFKQSWENLIAAQLFQPLEMHSAGFGAPGTPGKLDQPLGHRLSKDTMKLVPVVPGDPEHPADLPAVLAPAGLVHVSSADMILYLNAHLLRPESFLKTESWNILHTPPYPIPGDDYFHAMGWIKMDDGTIWHNAWNGRWYAEMRVDHVHQRVAFVGSNSGDRAKSLPAAEAVLAGAMAASR